MIVGSLGQIVFECSSAQALLLQSFSVSSDARWEEHAAQGTFPRPEFLGPSLPTHNLAILLRRDFLGHSPTREIRQIQAMLKNGEVVRRIVGRVGFGRVTIRKMDYSWHGAIRAASGPLSVSMNLELKEYA